MADNAGELLVQKYLAKEASLHVADITRGVKEPCSISEHYITACLLYMGSRLHVSCTQARGMKLHN